MHLVYSVLFACLYGYLGLGVALLILPAPLKRYTFPIAPLAGFSLATLAAWYFAILGFRGTDAYAVPLCALALLPLGYALYRRPWRIDDEPLLNSDSAIAGSLGALAFLIAAAPSMMARTGLTAVSLGNADIAFYAIMARYLKEFRLGETTGFFSQEFEMIGGTAIDRFGAVVATALPASLASLGTYQVQNVAMHVFFALMVMMAFIVAREVFEFRRAPAVLGTLLVAVNPLLYYTVFHDFVAQIIGMALALLLIVLHTQVFRASSTKAYLQFIPITTLMTWGLSVAYGHMVLILLVATSVGVCAAAWQHGSASSVRRWVVFCAATLVAVVCCSPERAWVALSQLAFFGGGVGGIVRHSQGWFMPWLFPSGLFTMPRAFPWLDVEVPELPLVHRALDVSFFALVLLGMLETHRHNRSRFFTVAAWMAPIAAGTVILAYVDRSAAGWGGYTSYKFLSFFTPLVLFCLVAPLAVPRRTRWFKELAAVSLALIGMTSAYFSWREVGVMRSRPSVTPEIVELHKIETMPGIDSVNLPATGEYLNTMWKANFMARKRLHIQDTTYFGRPTPEGNWTLLASPALGPAITVRVGEEPGPTELQVNAAYSLARVNSRLRIVFGEGWYPTDATIKWTGHGGSTDAFLILNVPKDPVVASIALEYWPLNPENQLSFYLDEQPIAECPKGSQRCTFQTALSRGERVVKLHASLPPERPDNGDPRVLGFALTKIEIAAPTGARAGSP